MSARSWAWAQSAGGAGRAGFWGRPGRRPRLAIGVLPVPTRRHVLAASVVRITSAQAFLPHAAAPSPPPRWADSQVTELALNPVGTAVLVPPAQARAGACVRVAAQAMATAPITRNARGVRLITHLLNLHPLLPPRDAFLPP